MPFDNGTSREIQNLCENSDPSYDTLPEDESDEEVEIFKGVDFTKFVKVHHLTTEEARQRADKALAKERPIDYRYIERMKEEGVTEELAIKAFVGRFGGNESQTRFFLNSDFYYGSDAPTPLTRLFKAREEDSFAECIEMIEGTKISWDLGDHF